MIVLGYVVSQNGWHMWIGFDDNLTMATSFSIDLLFPFGMLLHICPPSRLLAPTNKELVLAPKIPPGPGAQHNQLNRVNVFLILAPHFKLG